MSGLLAWLDTIPPRDQLLQITGELRELVLQDASAGAFKITVASGGALHPFEFEDAHRLVGLLSPGANLEGRGIKQDGTVTLTYYSFGRGTKVVDVSLDQEHVLRYDEVEKQAAEKGIRDQNSAIGFAALGGLLIFLGGAAQIARRGSEEIAAPDPDATIGVLLWLAFYGLALVVLLTEPAILHGAFGTEVFRVPIEYVVPVVLALLFIPFWSGCMGLAALTLHAMRKGRSSKLGLILELRSLLASNNPGERRVALKALWFFVYFVFLCAAWIIYAAMIGI